MFRACKLCVRSSAARRALGWLWWLGFAATALGGCASLSEAKRSDAAPLANQGQDQGAVGAATSPLAGAAASGSLTEDAAACPQARALDARAIAQEAACLLARYVRIDTSNPPGNELAAARFLKAQLEREGIPVSLVEPAPGRANLSARLSFARGKAIALAHHMDVVPADSTEWSVAPFGGVVRDGQLWGRGALDDKAAGVLSLLTMLLAKRLGIQLPYDLVLLALADEEAGGGLGARYLTSEQPQWLEDIAFVMNEGGGIIDLGDGRVVYQVEVAQKAPLWLRLVARGHSGHGAAPTDDMATAHLARALARLADHSFAIEVLPQVQDLFAHKASSLPEPLREGARDLRAALARPEFRQAFMREPHQAALVQNTLAISMLHGSDKENVIPGEASAVLDMRLLPGQAVPAVIAEVTQVVADPAIEVETLLSWTAHSSPRDSALFHAIEARAHERDPGAQVLANVIGGFTDCNAFRARGITCYGFMPMRLSPDAFSGIHGRDEHVRLDALGETVIAWLELLRMVPAP